MLRALRPSSSNSSIAVDGPSRGASRSFIATSSARRVASRPDSWRLAQALHETIGDANGRLPGRGHRVVKTDRGAVLVLRRSTGDRTALLSAFAVRYFRTAAPEGLAWRLADAGGEALVGDSSRTAAVSGSPPW